MNERIEKLTSLTLDGVMRPEAKTVEFDRNDIFLPQHQMSAKRTHDYIVQQTPIITEYQTMTGLLNLTNGQIEGDYMHCQGFEHIDKQLMPYFYNKPIENLSTFEWQHATPDYNKIIRTGINGVIEEIEISKLNHKDDAEKISFLNALKTVASTLIEWAHICSEKALDASKKATVPQYRKNLETMSETLKTIPENPARNFREAVQFIYILFGYEPDSLGTLDRTLYSFYKNDIENGTLTKEEAKIILQELFLMLQSNTPKSPWAFTKGGESHFCVGGYDENGDDIFNDFSMLILEALTELPTFIPQVSLRWTKKLPFETFLKILDMSVKDQNSRIAFINDEAKIYSAEHIAHIPFKIACKYTSVGCNEVAYPGSFFTGTTNSNILRSIQNTMYNRTEDILSADTWDKFFEIYKSELYKDIDLMIYYDDELNRIRAKDTSYVTALLFSDCIKEGKSFTQGACRYAVGGPGLIGIPNVLDSLIVIKQFVYDEKLTTMSELVSALKNNWEDYENLHALIKKRGKFFGNDDETSNSVAKLFCNTLFEYTKDKTSVFGYHLLFGNLQGYNPHHEIFGSATKATPDGRYDGENLKFGLGQSGAYDRNGLSALLNSVSKCDEHKIISGGPSVTNLYLDEQLVKNEDNLPKTAKLLETFFINGGSQFQLNYVSLEDLKKAKITPEDYANLRVRVSGFSDYFVNLCDSVQDDIINRTVKNS